MPIKPSLSPLVMIAASVGAPWPAGHGLVALVDTQNAIPPTCPWKFPGGNPIRSSFQCKIA